MNFIWYTDVLALFLVVMTKNKKQTATKNPWQNPLRKWLTSVRVQCVVAVLCAQGAAEKDAAASLTSSFFLIWTPRDAAAHIQEEMDLPSQLNFFGKNCKDSSGVSITEVIINSVKLYMNINIIIWGKHSYLV